MADALQRPVALTALGGGGYGSLQELLVVREERKSVRSPVDLFILQICDNDLFENNMVFNKDILPVGSLAGRPFSLDGHADTIVYDDSLAALVALDLGQRSHLIQRLLDVSVEWHAQRAFDQAGTDRLDRMTANLLAQDLKNEDRWASDSFRLTERLLTQIRMLFPADVPAFAVSCQVTAPWMMETWEELAEASGFMGVLWPAEEVWRARDKGDDVLLKDGYHWSDRGNAIFGHAAWRAAAPLLQGLETAAGGRGDGDL